MVSRHRVIAAVLGLVLPLLFAGAADATTRHRHHRRHSGHVSAATYHHGRHHAKIHRIRSISHRSAPSALTAGS